jgi:MFS transporter, UMF1 family
MSAPSSAGASPILERLGLHRPELRAWALYDCANSAAVTTIVTAIFPIYFASVAARGYEPARATQVFGQVTTAALVIVAVLSPVLGAVADVRPWKKRLLAAFAGLGVLATAGLFWVGPGGWLAGAILFLLVNVGLNGSFVFYDALLPHVAREGELDRVSSAGYAVGYLGGGALLAAQLVLILEPGWFGLDGADRTLPTRLTFLSVAIWWAAFSLPLLRMVKEHAPPEQPGARGAVVQALGRLGTTFRSLRRYRQAVLMLLAYLVYNDGIGTIIRMAAIYGNELGLPAGTLIGAILMVQFLGIPAAYLFAGMAGRIGTKRAVVAGLLVYCGVAVLGYFTRTAAHFWALAVLVALVQGGTQALSRSLFASLVPRRLSGEFFGFFSVSDKVAGILGPAVFTVVSAATGSSRGAVLSVIAFFVVGAALLAAVDVEAGRRQAAQDESPLQVADSQPLLH